VARPKPPAVTTSSYVASLYARVGKGAALTLDARLQTAAETALGPIGRAGGIVAIEPDTGTVRALFSVPGERGDPLLVAQVPGSTFKTFTAIAGLEAGVLTATTEMECRGTFSFGGKELRCAAVHGRETTAQAITRSCNAFFYAVGAEVDHLRVLEVAHRFGFGARTGIELSDEAGLVPDEAREEATRDPSSTVPLLDAIGHGEIRVTLLQLARAYAAIANGGKLVRLSVAGHADVERSVALRPEDLALIRSALVDVVDKDDGTAHAYAMPGFPFAGKTGSAEAPPRNGVETDDDTWFVAYAPPESPKILVAARIERADVARDAKWAVARVLDAWRSSRCAVVDTAGATAPRKRRAARLRPRCSDNPSCWVPTRCASRWAKCLKDRSNRRSQGSGRRSRSFRSSSYPTLGTRRRNV
jgi:penicillin-binding protein 2